MCQLLAHGSVFERVIRGLLASETPGGVAKNKDAQVPLQTSQVRISGDRP